jgi:glucose/arabinose dehydrogenase
MVPGMNSGWVQVMGPIRRHFEYKTIETSGQYFGLQQLRWTPLNIADTREEAMARLFSLPGSQYRAPEFAWRYEVSPGGIGFLRGEAWGPEYANNLFMGAASTRLRGGHLFRFRLTPDRMRVAITDGRLADRVADNGFKFDITESESLLFGHGFGIVTDVQTGPDGNLYLVSLDRGAVYRIERR